MMEDYPLLIDGALDGMLTDEQARALNDWLAADAEHVRQYVMAAFIHSRACDMLRQDDLSGLLFDGALSCINPSHIQLMLTEEEAAAERKVAEAAAEQARLEAEDEARRLLEEFWRRPPAPQRKEKVSQWLAYFTVGAAAAVLFVVVAILNSSMQKAAQQHAPPIARSSAPAKPVVVAKVVQSLAVQSVDGSQVVLAGSKLVAGPLELTDGMVEIEFPDEVRLVIEAPASLELMSANRVRVNKGRVVAHVPSTAIGFTVLSSNAAVIDLGTEFGLNVDESGVTSVQVYDGEVALVPGQEGGSSSSLTIPVGEAHSVVGNHGEIRSIEFKESAFIRQVPESAYELAVLKSRPLVYWRLNESAGASEVRSVGQLDLRGTVERGVELGVVGPPSVGRGNTAVALTDDHEGIAMEPADKLPSAGGFSLEAWAQISPDLAERMPGNPLRIISTISDSPSGGYALGIAGRGFGNRRVAPPVALVFTSYSVYDVVSTVAIWPGEWMHIVAVVDSQGYPKLYLNGGEVGLDCIIDGDSGFFRPLSADEWTTPHLPKPGSNPMRLGSNPPSPRDAYPAEKFLGSLDEVAVYDRELSADEALAHFQARSKDQ